MRLCKSCGKLVNSDLEQGPVYCSDQCRHLASTKIHKCEPDCRDETIQFRKVICKNNAIKLQQHCKLCLRTKFVPKSWAKLKFVSDKTNFNIPYVNYPT